MQERLGSSRRDWEVPGETRNLQERLGSSRRGWEFSGEAWRVQELLRSFRRGWEVSGENGKLPERLGSCRRGWEVAERWHQVSRGILLLKPNLYRFVIQEEQESRFHACVGVH